MAEGYEDIDRLISNQNQMLDKSLQQQNDIINKQTQMQVDSLARQKEDIDRETVQQNRAIYQDYKKNSNPFGVQAENLASQGLGNSGYAETTQARLYNTYQNNITSTLNNARQLKSDVDFQIQQARQTGDITLAQNALEIFNQRMQLLSQEYDLRNNREQFLYQKSQDALAQSNWQKEFNYQKSIDTRNFKYQKSRDKVADTQWQKEYELSKKAKASSSRGSRSTGGKKKTGNDLKPVDIGKEPENNNGSEYTPKEIIANIKNIQGPGVVNPIKDGISGKTFKSVDALLNYYGYAGVND